MPNEVISIDMIRYDKCYDMQNHFDRLYATSCKKEAFDNLMQLIFSKESVLLAYRNIKSSSMSNISGVDYLTINDISNLTLDQVVSKVKSIIIGKNGNYFPKPVKEKIIKKDDKYNYYGIPCIWDRLIQQCIKQILEPICEAKFSKNSYGYRPNLTVENAIAKAYFRAQRNNLYQVIEFDICRFYKTVNHTKLIHQLWSLGIHDKHLLYIIRRILKSPINMVEGQTCYPSTGIVQSGILIHLFANIVLNELDHWIESQWEETPIKNKFTLRTYSNGTENKSHVYRCLRVRKLKEMFIVRYGEEFRIFCKTKTEAVKTKEAVRKWLQKRLKLELNNDKTRIVNIKRKDFTFLGFRIKVRLKRKKLVIRSHIEYKRLSSIRKKLIAQAKNIAKPRHGKTSTDEVRLFNSIVLGVQNYYRYATNINIDCHILYRSVMTILTNRLKTRNGTNLKRSGRKLTELEYKYYGNTRMMRYYSSGEPIYPIGLVQCKIPMHNKIEANSYTYDGRKILNLINKYHLQGSLIKQTMRQPLYNRSLEFMNNRIELYYYQNGKCAISKKAFDNLDEIHCHHIIPIQYGGTDERDNLILILDMVHRLIHAINPITIHTYINALKLNISQIKDINRYRELAHLDKIVI